MDKVDCKDFINLSVVVMPLVRLLKSRSEFSWAQREEIAWALQETILEHESIHNENNRINSVCEGRELSIINDDAPFKGVKQT